MLTMKEQLADYDVDFGEVTITPTANTWTNVTLNFNVEFRETPVIFANPNTKYAGTCMATATSNTTTSGTISLYRGDTTTTIVHWLAIGKKK